MSTYVVTAIFFVSVAVAWLAFDLTKLKRNVRKLEQQLKDFDVIPQTFDATKSP